MVHDGMLETADRCSTDGRPILVLRCISKATHDVTPFDFADFAGSRDEVGLGFEGADVGAAVLDATAAGFGFGFGFGMTGTGSGSGSGTSSCPEPGSGFSMTL